MFVLDYKDITGYYKERRGSMLLLRGQGENVFFFCSEDCLDPLQLSCLCCICLGRGEIERERGEREEAVEDVQRERKISMPVKFV